MITAPSLWYPSVTESVALPPIRGKHHAPVSKPVVSLPFVAIERPACPKCKAQMMLVSIEPVRACVVDLHTLECAVCNQVLKTFAAYEDPMT
jgi:phage FluMu protein Com